MRKDITAACRWVLIVGAATMLSACYQTTGDLASPLSTASIDAQGSGPRLAPQAGRGTRAPTIPEAAPPPEYLTLEKAKGDCWMQAETDKKVPKAVEARGKWVEKCAAAKMREQATQWANPSPQASSPPPQAASLPTMPSFLSQPTPAASPPPRAPNDVTQNGL
jgi:hypothetical protein